MKRFRNFPIKQKMLVMTLVICGAVLLVAVAVLFVFQLLNFRTTFQHDNSTLAIIIASQSTAAMSFEKDTDAAEVLGSLAAKPSVVAASLVLLNGKLLAQFGKPEDAITMSQFPPAGSGRFTDKEFLITQPFIERGDRVGTRAERWDGDHHPCARLRYLCL